MMKLMCVAYLAIAVALLHITLSLQDVRESEKVLAEKINIHASVIAAMAEEK